MYLTFFVVLLFSGCQTLPSQLLGKSKAAGPIQPLEETISYFCFDGLFTFRISDFQIL